MTTLTWILFALTLVIAVVDWFAVHTENTSLEYLAKPATMVPLIAAAGALDPAVPAMRTWFIVALVFSLLGDVFLMLPEPKLFVAGLGSFLIGHIAYIIGMRQGELSGAGLVVGAVLVITGLIAIGPTVVKGAHETDSTLAVPVLVYMIVISIMVVFAIGSGVTIAIAGAGLFFASDLAIGWSRFVDEFPRHRMVIIVTYHLAQILLVGSLVVAR